MALYYRVQQETTALFKNRSYLFLFFLLIFGMGVIYGTGVIYPLPFSERLLLLKNIETLFGQPSLSFLSWQDIFYQQLLQLSLFYLLGISLLGLPLIPLLLFIRGFIVGSTVGFLLQELSYMGFFLALLTVIPPHLILLPTMILLSVTGVIFTYGLIRRLLGKGEFPLFKNLLWYSIVFLVSALLFFVASLLEAYGVPVLLDLFFLFTF